MNRPPKSGMEIKTHSTFYFFWSIMMEMDRIPLTISSMRKTIYNDKQIELLKANRYVRECSSKYITFTDDCKIDALRLDEQGWYSQDIFRHFGFPDFFIDSPSPGRTLKHWRHVMRMK